MQNHRCRPVIASLITIVATILMVSITATIAAQSALRSRTSVAVVDAKGVKVGDVFSLVDICCGLIGAVAFEVNKEIFVVLVSPQGFTADEPNVVLFTSSDCSSPPFVVAEGGPTLFPAAAVTAPGSTVYLAEPDATFEHLANSWRLVSDGSCVPFGELGALPAHVVINLDTLFTPPFSVR
jgi:hypothetical protein